MPRIIGRDERVTPRSGAEDIVAAIAESTRASLAAVNASLGEIAAVACSAPGPLQEQRLDHRNDYEEPKKEDRREEEGERQELFRARPHPPPPFASVTTPR